VPRRPQSLAHLLRPQRRREALDWFCRVARSELGDDEFYAEYVPRVLDAFFRDPDPDAREAELPEYVPYLGGSRYSLERLTASLGGVTLETTREDLLLSLVRGNATYLGGHLREVAELVPIGRRVGSPAAGEDPRHARSRRRWTGEYEYVFQDQSSLLGAAISARSVSRDGCPVPDRSRRVTQEAISMSAIGTGSTTSTDAKAAPPSWPSGESRARGRRRWPSCSRRRSTTRRPSCPACRAAGGVPCGRIVSTGVFQDDGWITSERRRGQPDVDRRPAGRGRRRGRGDGDGFAAGKEAASAALKQLGGAAGALLTIAFMGPEEEILRGIAEVAPGVPVVGGTSSDHSPDGKFQQFANGHAFKNHFAVAALGGPIGYAFTNGYRPTGKKVTVRLRGRRSSSAAGGPWMSIEWVAARIRDRRRRSLVSFSAIPAALPQGWDHFTGPPGQQQRGRVDGFRGGDEPRHGAELGEASVNGLIAEAQRSALGTAGSYRSPIAAVAPSPSATGSGDPAEVEHAVGRARIGYPRSGSRCAGGRIPPMPT
jgi:hypothetical protein